MLLYIGIMYGNQIPCTADLKNCCCVTGLLSSRISARNLNVCRSPGLDSYRSNERRATTVYQLGKGYF